MRIIESSSYLPQKKVSSKELAEKLNLTEEYIIKRTGIKERYFAQSEKIEEMAEKAVKKLIEKAKIDPQEIDLIIVATTSTDKLMPGISNYIQKKLNIEKCICFDILAGCSGYINAIDIAQMYINSGKAKKVLVIGVDILSKYTNPEDVGTAIILSDGAGAILFEKSMENKYYSNIVATIDEKDILTCTQEDGIQMEGLSIYKYAVKETVKNINELLEKTGESLENIKYIIPHQSNLKIINSIAEKLCIEKEKIYINIQNTGNTFCASIPIAIDEMLKKNMLKKNDKIVIIGYGGGLNTGSILLQI